MSIPIYDCPLERDEDLVAVRRRIRVVSASLGFSAQDQTRIATAVSEIARNCIVYANSGRVEVRADEISGKPHLIIRVVDAGRGIENLQKIVSGEYRSTTGLGLGIQGAKRLVDHFRAMTGPEGTTIELGKTMPEKQGQSLSMRATQAAAHLREEGGANAVAELHQQNRELLQSLQSLREREEELLAANAALHKTTESLEASLNEKEVLLREVYHRVKNNLQIVTSLVRLQASRNKDAAVREELSALAGRIRSLSLIHDKLYQRQNVARIALDEYVSDLCSQLGKVLADPEGKVRVDCTVCNDVIPLDSAIHIGLFLNEAVTNAFKHGFPDQRTGRIEVKLDSRDDHLLITVRDEGVGISESERDGSGGSLGMTLMRTMAAALNADLTIEANGGTLVRLLVPITWKVPDSAGRQDEERTGTPL